MSHCIDVPLTAKIIEVAQLRVESYKQIKRTRGSNIDGLVGVIGEMVFAEWLWGDWNHHHPVLNHGKTDIAGRIEVKASAVPFRNAKNMLRREDYMSRKAEFYVQLLIDTKSKQDEAIVPGLTCRIAGWTDHATFSSAPLVRHTGKEGQPLNYLCYTLPLSQSRPMDAFPKHLFPRPRKVSCLDLMNAR